MSDQPKPAISAQVEKLRAKVELYNAKNALIKSKSEELRLNFMNGMSDLVSSAGYQQENITSWTPLITNSQYTDLTLSYNVLMNLYASHSTVQTAIDQPVSDAHGDPIGLTSKELSHSNLGELEDWLEANQVWEPFRDTQNWGRLFGGSALVINVAGDPSKPLNFKELERGRFALYPAARWELGGTWRYSPFYNFYGINIHESRVKTFIGKRMPWIQERRLSGWGASLLARAVLDFNLYLRTRDVLFELLNEAKIDVFKFENFTQQLATGQGTADTERRLGMMNALKSFHSALLMDKNDDYEQKTLAFTGIAQVMQENRMGLASAFRMPISKLFGTQAEGFANGEDANENYNSMVKNEVRHPARPLMRELLTLGATAVFGKPYHVDFEYPPLRTLGAKEEEEVKSSKQTRILGQLEAGLIDEAEAAAWAKHEKLVPITTKLAERGLKKTGLALKDVPARNAGKSDREQGDDNGKWRGIGLGGDARQVPHFG